jgi:hypothetical protein
MSDDGSRYSLIELPAEVLAEIDNRLLERLGGAVLHNELLRRHIQKMAVHERREIICVASEPFSAEEWRSALVESAQEIGLDMTAHRGRLLAIHELPTILSWWTA